MIGVNSRFPFTFSFHRTGDVFGENIDKFKRNRKSRTSPPRWFLIRDLDIVGTKYKRWNSSCRVERMESFLRERSKERILNWGNSFQPEIFEGLRVTEASRIQEHLHASITQDLSKTSSPRSRLQLVIFSLFSYFSTKTPDMILSLSLSMEKVRVKMLETPSPAQPNVIL